MDTKIGNSPFNINRQNSISAFDEKYFDSSSKRLQTDAGRQKFPVPPFVETKTVAGEDPNVLHRRHLMEAASEAGLDGTRQQTKFVEKYLKGGIIFADKKSDPSPDDDLTIKSSDLTGKWQTYNLSSEQIADLQRLQKEFVAEGGILKRGKTYENTAAGESFLMARRGDTIRRPMSDEQYKTAKLWEQAQVLPSSIFGTPAKLQDLKHISINVPAGTTAEQTDRVLSAYIEKNYGDRDNLWSDDKADILQIAKTNGVKIENLSVKNGKADFDLSVESLLKLHIAYLGVQEKANITEASVKDLQNNSAFNQFIVGVGEGAWNNLKDTGEALTHPINTLHGICEGAKAAGSIAVELAKMPQSERTALYVQLAAAGVKGLSGMTAAQASRQIGKFVGSLAVDVALGKPIGKAILLLKDLKLGTKIIRESVELSKTIKQSLGNIKVPLSDMKVVSDTMGNKWWIRDGELKKLEDVVKMMKSGDEKLDMLKGGSTAGREVIKDTAEEGLTDISQSGIKQLKGEMSKEVLKKAKEKLITLNVARTELIAKLDDLIANNNLLSDTRNVLTSTKNSIKDHLTQDDLVGALRDKFGKEVRRSGDGKVFNHLGEVEDGIESLNRANKLLLKELNRTTKGSKKYVEISEQLDAIKELRRRIKDFLEVK